MRTISIFYFATIVMFLVLKREDGHVLRRTLEFKIEGQRRKESLRKKLMKQVEQPASSISCLASLSSVDLQSQTSIFKGKRESWYGQKGCEGSLRREVVKGG